VEKLQPLRTKLGDDKIDASGIAAGTAKAGD